MEINLDAIIKQLQADVKDEWALHDFLLVKAPDLIIDSYVAANQKRLTELWNTSDYTEIFHRELGKAGLTDKPDTYNEFRKALASYVESLVERHERDSKRKDKIANAEWVTVAKSFLEYLSNERATSSPTATDNRKIPFNGMPLDEVRKWFIQLAETNSKNGSPFLTIEQVNQFIDRAFCGNDTIQELTFNLADGERTSVTKLFYLFFNRCTNDFAIEPTKHSKEKYVRLLTDNFTNYNYQTVFDNFNNSKNAPKGWKTTVL